MPLQQFERPNFFTGELLSVDDLQREQEYHRSKARLHNRFLHGWGVVTGLRVSIDQGDVVVSAGLALDCAGNELVLPRNECVALPIVATRLYVTARYVEIPVGQVPSSNGQMMPSIIREAIAIELSSSDPRTSHGPFPEGSPGCGMAHAICLGIVTLRGKRWTVTGRRRGAPAGKRGRALG